MGEKINVRIFESTSWVSAADWNELLTSINDLRTSLALALEPVRSWYGKERNASLDIIVEVVADLQKDRAEVFKLREEVQKLKAELEPPSPETCEAFVKKLKAFLELRDAIDQTKGLESHPLVKPLQEACTTIEKLNKAELRRVAELHTVYTEKSDLNAVLQRALKDVAVFEDLASKAETARVIRLETCLREIAKSPNWRGVPNWVVLKIQEVVGC